MAFERHIPLDGASNFRDFGGYATADGRRVKWRRLFRSDHLAGLTASDFEQLAPHGIRLVCDLRRDSEVMAAPTHWPGTAGPEIFNSPLLGNSATSAPRAVPDPNECRDGEWARAYMRKTYARLVTEPVPLAAFGRIFERLATADAFPALIHCTAGKDRTGATCALILSALGVAREHVVEDFMLTGKYYNLSPDVKRHISQIIESSQLGAVGEEALTPILSVEPSYIETTLDLIDAEGGIDAFLQRKAGVDPAALQRLRDELLE
jgi:protein-tyrosine phosphatase